MGSARYFNSTEVTPREVLAGDSVEITVRLVLGPDFSAEGSRIVFDLPGYLGYSRPTCLHQELSGYVEVFCDNPDLHYTKRVWDIEISDFPAAGRGGFKGMAQRLFILDFDRGTAEEGDEILVKWGYVCNGFSCGTKVTSLVLAPEFYNTIHVRYFADGARGLPDLGRSFKGYARPTPDVEIPVRYRVLPREPDHLRLIRKEKESFLLVLDRFANICQAETPAGFIRERVPARRTAAGLFVLERAAKVSSQGLPLEESPDVTHVYQDLNLYFGDLHVHTAYSVDCIEREKQEMTPEQTLAYARDVACLDFAAVTDHHQPARDERHRIGEENWALTLDAVRRFHRDGEFAAFPGFEFRCERGDTTVVLGEELGYGEIDRPALTDVKALWEHFKGRDYLTIPHFHNPGHLPEGCWDACPYEGVEPVLEIFSCHGSYESDEVLERHIAECKSFRADRHGRYFLRQGYHYGFVCSSDGHKGNVGQNGLVAVYARELTREAVLAALRDRHVYGTTNARLRLLFTMNGHLMGEILPNVVRKAIFLSVAGERPLKAVDLFRDGELYRRFKFKPGEREFQVELTVHEEAPSNWYVRATQVDNHIAYSSPIWFCPDGDRARG